MTLWNLLCETYPANSCKRCCAKLESYRQETIDTVRHIIHDTSIRILVSITACLIFGAQQITHFQEPYLILWRQGLNRGRILNSTGRHALGVHQPTEQCPELHRIQIQKDTSITILWKNLVPTSTEQLRQARTFNGGQSVSSCHEAGVSTHVQPEWWMLCKAVPIGSFKKSRGQNIELRWGVVYELPYPSQAHCKVWRFGLHLLPEVLTPFLIQSCPIILGIWRFACHT